MKYIIIILLFVLVALITRQLVSNFDSEKRVAICIYGRTTTWKDNMDEIKSVFSKSFKYPIDYFSSNHADETNTDTQEFIKSLNPVKYNIEKIKPREGFPPNKQRMISSFHHKHKCSKMITETGINYDWVVLTRIDLKHNQDMIDWEDELPAENTLYVPVAFKDWVETTDRTPDQVNAGSLNTIKAFTEIYEQDHSKFDIHNPSTEVEIYKYITQKGIQMKKFLWLGKPDMNRDQDSTLQNVAYDE